MIPTAHEYHLKGCMTLLAGGAVMLGGLLWLIAWNIRADWTNVTAPAGYIGNADRGEMLIGAYGCTSCHALGKTAPLGQVGPPLDTMASRSYVAGRFANNEIWMTQWLEHPQALKPGTAMPDLGVSRRDALDIAAYLATMKR